MEYLAGILGALALAGVANALEFDKDRSFYPVILIVIALLYVLFAVMSERFDLIVKESIMAFLFIVIAIVGAKVLPMMVVIGLFAHGVFDLVHNQWIENPVVPWWWPGICVAFDVALATWLLYLLRMHSTSSRQSVP